MNFRDVLYDRRMKQVTLAKALSIDPSRVCLFVSGIKKLPKKYDAQLQRLLGLSSEEFRMVQLETMKEDALSRP